MKRNAQKAAAQQKQLLLTQPKQKSIKTVTLLVGGHKINIKTDKDEGYLHALADSVNEVINSLKDSAPTASTLQTIALASIHFADKLHETHQSLDTLKSEVLNRTDRMMKLLDGDDLGSDDVKDL